MKATEFRIGNWVYAKTNKGKIPAKIDNLGRWAISADDADGNNYVGRLDDIEVRCIEPIELTDEILDKCGFKKQYIKEYPYLWKKEFLTQTFDSDIFASKYRVCIKRDDTTGGYILHITLFQDEKFLGYMLLHLVKYVHSLQNFIFELTNKELEIGL